MGQAVLVGRQQPNLRLQHPVGQDLASRAGEREPQRGADVRARRADPQFHAAGLPTGPPLRHEQAIGQALLATVVAAIALSTVLLASAALAIRAPSGP